MFFDNYENEDLGRYESSTSFELFPEGTELLASVDQVNWKEYEGERYIEVRWSALAPEQYKNRKVFQKIKVLDGKEETAKKARRMLAAIDANAGGKLRQKNAMPTDMDLMAALLNSIMMIKLGVWKVDGKEGNLVRAVSPRGAAKATPQAPAKATPHAPVIDDDIPF